MVLLESEDNLPGIGIWPNLNLSGLARGSLGMALKCSPGVGEDGLELVALEERGFEDELEMQPEEEEELLVEFRLALLVFLSSIISLASPGLRFLALILEWTSRVISSSSSSLEEVTACRENLSGSRVNSLSLSRLWARKEYISSLK